MSVVVPVRNRQEAIGACIESLLAQDYAHREILVVDNGSTDGTREVIQRRPVTLLVEREIQTSYAARNLGIRHAKGEIVAFIDSDCVAAPGWLAHLVPAFSEANVGAVVGCIADAPPQSLAEQLTARIQPFARPDCGGLKTLLTANVAIRREALERLHLFDAHLPTAGDVDLGWRMQLQLGLTIAEAPDAVVWHSHRTTMRDVFAQYRRYGASEILLSTLYRGGAGSLTRGRHLRQMLRQSRACASYVASFFVRLATLRSELAWPLFLLVVESGNLLGKIGALLATRGCTRNPYRRSHT